MEWQGTIRGTIPNSLSTAVFHVIMIHSDDDISDNCKVCSPTVHLPVYNSIMHYVC